MWVLIGLAVQEHNKLLMCSRFKTSSSKNQSFLEEEVHFRFSKITHLSTHTVDLSHPSLVPAIVEVSTTGEVLTTTKHWWLGIVLSKTAVVSRGHKNLKFQNHCEVGFN